MKEDKQYTFLSLCSGGGLLDLGLERSGFKCLGQVEIIPYALEILNKHWKNVPKHTNILTLLVSDSLAKTYLKQTTKERGLRAKKALSSLSVCESLTYLNRNGYSSRMFPDCFPLTKDGTWQWSYKKFPKAGMGTATEFLTVNISEYPNDVVESSLSDVLEKSVPLKYYLSRKAVAGIIKRTLKDKGKGYVFLQKIGNKQLKQIIPLSFNNLLKLILQKNLSCPIHWEHIKEELLEEYGKTIILRKLTPVELERLQGLPDHWTLSEHY